MPLLFSYGTLQQEAVQITTFGRRLEGGPDALLGYERSTVIVKDPAFVAESGSAEHAIVIPAAQGDSRVEGMVFEVTNAELAQTDAYEPDGYVRMTARLASGRTAWVYTVVEAT